jgi:ParB family chromosome partitioning protein
MELRHESPVVDGLVEVDVDELKSPSWTLRPLDQDIVGELARSIANVGLLEPIVVRQTPDGLEVVFGNHRLAACRHLGRRRISAMLKEFDDDEAFLARVSENLLRNGYVNPIEEAQGYRMLVKKGWCINAIGKKVGKCDSYICERLALLDRLDHKICSKIAEGRQGLSPSHAELLSRISDKTKQKEIADLIEKKRLSVRALEDMMYGVPPPRKTQIEGRNGELWVRIPAEFSRAANVISGQSVYMYVRGRKLVLENLENPVRRRKRLQARKTIYRSSPHHENSLSVTMPVASVTQ